MTQRALLLAILLATTLACGSSVSAATIGNWTFDEGEGDTTKNTAADSHHGKLTGATWVDSENGKALVFQGPDYSGPYKPPGSFVAIDDSAGLNPTKKVTVRANIYPTATPVAWGGIVEKGVGYGSSFRLVVLRNGKLRAAVGNAHATVDSPEPIPLNAWTRVEMRYDGKQLALLVGGKSVAKGDVTIDGFSSEAPIEIGRRFTGRIDDVEVEY